MKEEKGRKRGQYALDRILWLLDVTLTYAVYMLVLNKGGL